MGRYRHSTAMLIYDAERRLRAGDVLTREEEVLVSLSDGGWHSNRELAAKVDHRFGGYLHTLRGRGVAWVACPIPDTRGGSEYRLLTRQEETDGQLGLF